MFLKKGKTTKWKRMISQRDGGNGMKKTKAHLVKEVDRMEITRVKMEMCSFLDKLEP